MSDAADYAQRLWLQGEVDRLSAELWDEQERTKVWRDRYQRIKEERNALRGALKPFAFDDPSLDLFEVDDSLMIAIPRRALQAARSAYYGVKDED
jgi:hypothetical protein